jgi:hypothetical protein
MWEQRIQVQRRGERFIATIPVRRAAARAFADTREEAVSNPRALVHIHLSILDTHPPADYSKDSDRDAELNEKKRRRKT